MTEIAYTRNYVTQEQLRRAYARLDHTSRAPEWSATLLIDEGLDLWWACPVLEPTIEFDGEPSVRSTWHIIAKAGELDWPPLKPEDEVWPALLAKEPVPTGERAERAAKMMGHSSVEDWHRDVLRQHYFGDAHIGGMKRNPTDVNFDPVARDWDATARELAAFIDTHRPPKLTSEQRVMVKGVEKAELEARLASVKVSLGHLMRNAARDQGPRLRHGFKSDMARWGDVTRPTVDAWLADGGCCEGAVPGENGHTHTDATGEQVR